MPLFDFQHAYLLAFAELAIVVALFLFIIIARKL